MEFYNCLCGLTEFGKFILSEKSCNWPLMRHKTRLTLWRRVPIFPQPAVHQVLNVSGNKKMLPAPQPNNELQADGDPKVKSVHVFATQARQFRQFKEPQDTPECLQWL